MFKALKASEHTLAYAIIAVFAILASLYSVISPVFEVSDELSHFPVIDHIARTGALPVQDPAIETLWEQEGSQPPLYYVLSAAIVRWVDTTDLEEIRTRNPHAKIGIPGDFDNKNMIIHTEAEDFPWQGAVLAVQLVRFFSVGLGVGSLTLTYLFARELFDGERWLSILTMALVAFNPMFLFITGSVNNDNLTVLLTTWIMLLSMRIVRQGITHQRAVTLALVFALASITKVSGVTFAAIMGVALLAHGLQTGRWRESFNTGFAITGAWLVIALWWYVRNIVLYGELTGTAMQVAIAGARPPIGLFELLREEWFSFWVAYWGWFGGVNILGPGWMYAVFGLISTAAIVGSVAWFVHKGVQGAWRDLLLPGMLVMQLAIILAALIHWTMTTYASQGRLIFPLIAAVSALSALGLLGWLPKRYRPPATAVIVLPLLVISIMTPFTVIRPAYAMPPTVEALPPDATPMETQWGPLELVGIRTESATVHPGEYLPFTAYWRLTAPTETDYTTTYTAFGRDETLIGKIDSYPGGGVLPTSRMEPGTIIVDQYRIPLDDTLQAPTAAWVAVGVGLQEETGFTVLDPDIGQVVLSEAGGVYPNNLAVCAPPPTFDAAVSATFGEVANLQAAPLTLTPGQDVTVSLLWETQAPTPTPLTVFVHLVDEEGALIAQADGPPFDGNYPSNLWRMPCTLPDEFTLSIPADLPPGTYRVLVGLYDANDPQFARLPAADPTRAPYPNNAVPIIEQQLP